MGGGCQRKQHPCSSPPGEQKNYMQMDLASTTASCGVPEACAAETDVAGPGWALLCGHRLRGALKTWLILPTRVVVGAGSPMSGLPQGPFRKHSH